MNPHGRFNREQWGVAALLALSALSAALLPAQVSAEGAGRLASDVVLSSNGAPTAEPMQTASSSSLAFTETPFLPLAAAAEVAAVDLNGDGRLDVIRTPLQVFLGNGDGTVSANGPAIDDGYAIVTVDITGDGLLDLVSTNAYDGFVLVFRGNGNGTFELLKEYKAGKQTHDLAVADLNGDGLLDIAGSDEDTGKLYVLIANKGGFKNRVNYLVGPGPRGVALVDFDRDGRLDLLNVNGNGLSVLRGNGDGSFQPPYSIPLMGIPPFDPRDLDVLDLNGDGKLDVVVTKLALDGGGEVFVMLGNGDGTVGSKAFYPLGSSVDGSRETALGDLNQDGIPDMAVTNPATGSVYVLLGNGDGTFTFEGSHPVNFACNSAAIADMNGDGLNDVVIDSAVLLNLGAAGAP